jgi:hypothetical protein
MTPSPIAPPGMLLPDPRGISGTPAFVCPDERASRGPRRPSERRSRAATRARFPRPLSRPRARPHRFDNVPRNAAGRVVMISLPCHRLSSLGLAFSVTDTPSDGREETPIRM